MLENTEEIFKPWAAYHFTRFMCDGIGKVVKDQGGSLYIEYHENQHYSPELWDSTYVRTFDSPVKAIAYFLVYQNRLIETPWTRREIIRDFLNRFPSQRESLEKYTEVIF